MHSTLCPDLIGRAEERAALAHRLDELAAGAGGVVVLVGDAGHGKSRLARETAAAATGRGFRAATGHAGAGGSPVPFGAVTEALLAGFRSIGRPPAAALAGFAPHLGRLVPEWGTGSAESSPLLVGEAVVRLLRASGPGWVLVLEDLQWADEDTIAVVEFLVGALRSEAVLCVVTVRSGADGPTARLRRRGATVIDLGPLAAPEIDAMAAACLGVDTVPEGVGPFLRTLTEGSPFLVEELLADLIATGALVSDPHWTVRGPLIPIVTRSVAESVGVRLRSMSPEERRVLSAAAVLGREFDWRLVAEASGVAAGGVAAVGEPVAQALRRAVDEQVLVVEGNGFRFRHALIRQAVVESLLPPERAALAARALAAVERAHPGFPRDTCELAAALAETAGDLDRAAELLVECGRRASDRGALAAAEATLLRARDLDTADGVRFRVERELVEVWVQIGAAPRALSLAQALTTRMPVNATADDRLALLGLVATAALAAGDTDAAETAIKETGSGSPGAQARAAVVAAHVALAAGRTTEAADLARAARTGAVTADVECDALWVVGRVTEDFGGKLAAFREAADIADRAGLAVRRLALEHECAILTAVLGDPADLVGIRETAQAAGAAATAASADLLLADLAFSALDHDTCLAAATRCVEAGRRFGHATLPVGLLWLAGAHALAGRDAEMEAALAEAAEVAPGDPRIAADALGRVRATRALLRGDRAELAEVLDRSMEYVRVAPATGAVFSGRVVWAIVHSAADADLGAAARAEVAAAGYLDAVPVLAAVRSWAEAVAAGRAGGTGCSVEAASHYARGEELLTPATRASGTVHLARLLVAEAALRDGWGDPVAWLREGEGFFFDRGQERLARDCRMLIGAAGAPPPRRRRGSAPVPPALRAFGVTEREHEVLALVAAGSTNREIADRLVLSVRTVEHHIASLLRRTGVRDRGQLAALVG
ncbi:hypothetical protein GCM10009836_48570 [Pseudonocardia ailaonensis]|uniref:HTH luxR-type domain-containing protein n=1 Tax=Pseudonocardia ailaonensis TaxID=367279 RepID=A0ABN2NEA1_9PSEU